MSIHQNEIDKLDLKVQAKLQQYVLVANDKNYPGLLFSIVQVKDLLDCFEAKSLAFPTYATCKFIEPQQGDVASVYRYKRIDKVRVLRVGTREYCQRGFTVFGEDSFNFNKHNNSKF